jgi:ribosomal protein L11 methyltransferase
LAEHPRYHRRAYRLPAELEDDLVADLWALGTLGVESTPAGEGWVVLAAWFADPPKPGQEAEPGRLESRWRRRGVEWLGQQAVAEQDWLAAWRAQAQPFEVGRRFLLDPREPEEASGDGEGGGSGETSEPTAGEDRIRLRLPARRAFGTGSHESTRLAVELLEDFFAAAPSPRAVRLLDVGTGTGVLAFAALALGAGSAVGCDLDPQAVFQARVNTALNRRALDARAPLWLAGGVAALAPVPLDLVVANLLPERILPEIAEVGRRVGAEGELILSGILETRGPEVLARLGEIGFTAAASRREGEWVAYRLRKRGPRGGGG